MGKANQISRALIFAQKSLEKAMFPQEITTFLKEMESQYNNFKQLPNLKHPKNQMIIKLAVDSLAFFRSLPKNWNKSDKLNLVQQFVNHWMDGQFERWVARFVYSNLLLHKLYRMQWFKAVNKADEPDGQKFAIIKYEPKLFYGVNVIRCGVVKFLKQENAGEIAPILCNGDFHICKYLPKNIVFKRTMVIAQGYDICDFRYYFKTLPTK